MMDNNQIQALGGNFTIDSILSHQKAFQNAQRDYPCSTTRDTNPIHSVPAEMVALPKQSPDFHEAIRSVNAGKPLEEVNS